MSAFAHADTPNAHKENDDKCLVDVGSGFDSCWVEGKDQICDFMSPMEGGHQAIPNGCMRSNIFSGNGYVAAYPSIGGVVFLKNPSAVDLQHLGLPHTHDTERPQESHEEEDALAARMARLGAQWWPTWYTYLKHQARMDMNVFYDYHAPPDVHVGYPSTGGVWVANFTRDWPLHVDEDSVCEPWLPVRPDIWRFKMRYALTMDDKCEMMKDMGATYYDRVEVVPGIGKTVEEAKSLFEPFKERLEKMEDDTYRNRFCTYDPDEAEDVLEHDKPRWGTWSLFG